MLKVLGEDATLRNLLEGNAIALFYLRAKRIIKGDRFSQLSTYAIYNR
ncbi:hypothetical protein QUB68_13870 [Microcoleus sp. A006_D1]